MPKKKAATSQLTLRHHYRLKYLPDLSKKELKQRNKELNSKINYQNTNFIKGKQAVVDTNYIKNLGKRVIVNENDLKNKGISLRNYFKEQNIDLYKTILLK